MNPADEFSHNLTFNSTMSHPEVASVAEPEAMTNGAMRFEAIFRWGEDFHDGSVFPVEHCFPCCVGDAAWREP